MTHFEFKRFKPPHELTLYANALLIQLFDFIPDGEISSATIVRSGEKYQCKIFVRGQSSNFREETLSRNPRVAIEMVNEKIKKQMLDWQVARLADHSPEFWSL